MPDFNVRSDSVNVEQIMDQIRARIREKRGVDYTEQQIHDLAKVKLEKFLDPRGLRSDLLDQFKKQQPPYRTGSVPSLVFEDTTMFETHRGLLRFIRKLLNPLLRLFFNPNALIHALHTQAHINKANLERDAAREVQRRDLDGLYFEVIHNLVVELTRTGIEMKNLTMRVESLASRVEFNERRARALESAVMYRPSAEEKADVTAGRSRVVSDRPPSPRESPRYTPPTLPPSAPSPPPQPQAAAPQGGGRVPVAEGPGQRSRRRRRRRGRRSGAPAASVMSGAGGTAPSTETQGAGDRDESVDHDGSADRQEAEDHAADHEAAPNVADADGGSVPDSDHDQHAAPKADVETFTGAESHRSEPPDLSTSSGSPRAESRDSEPQ